MSETVAIQSTKTGHIYLVLPSVAEARIKSGQYAKVDRQRAEALRQASVIHSR